MIAGIVCEYNPFHNGHLYQIEKTRQAGADAVICVMSGNFVQRGECAIIDKHKRALCAIRGGADLVIDLPVPWALGSAESFARGSISLLAAMGIDILSFGSESDDKELLYLCARACDDEKTASQIKKLMSEGLSYPAALSSSAGEIYGERVKELLSLPNSTLAVEYIRQLRLYSPDCNILPVKRIGVSHDSDDTSEGFASASRIRESISESDVSAFIPDYTAEAVNQARLHSLKYAERAVLSSLREMPKQEYSLHVTDSKGLAERIYNSVKNAVSLEELCTAVKSKNYTLSRIRREILRLYLKIPADYEKRTPPYIRVLAANEKGLSLLKNASLPVVTKHSDAALEDAFCKEIYSLQCSSTDKFSLMSEKISPMGQEQKSSVIIVK